ncbi:hypothetical protein FOA43_003004 [Brettanomyces nanus]|uniref:RRM domain-containing protein n=1 Tax=Eeniella nana TaxID=13502 RepID=A0A875RVL6_EENNA|nr:uncharacterized protein FOA43_003004 [Brettanomyces nanus]QPG75647.1 hypothetical protein FOA43_003004 [Brettanomyces nanus]
MTLENNPLFQALNGKRGKKDDKNPLELALRVKRVSKASKTNNIGRVSKANKTNKIGRVSKVKVSKVAKKVNPLALALGIETSKGRNKLPQEAEKDVKRIIGKTRNGLVHQKQQKKPVNFIGASQTSFLRLRNLSPGVTESDIVEIMSKYGTVLKVMTVEGFTREFGKSVTAELFFMSEDSMYSAQKALDGRMADSHRLRVEISHTPIVVIDPEIWKKVVKEIKLIREERETLINVI